MAIDYPEPHRREALIGTLVVHGLLLLLFIFMVFKGPNPPLAALGGGDGVELNYGLDPAGSGDIQSIAPANDSRNREDSRPPVASPDPQPRPMATATPDPTPPSQEKIITSEADESPVSVAPVETPAPAKEEVKVIPKAPRKVAVAFSPKGSATGGGNGVNGTSNAPTGNNNGDRPGTVGDQGDPNGSLDSKALYGNGGDGDGMDIKAKHVPDDARQLRERAEQRVEGDSAGEHETSDQAKHQADIADAVDNERFSGSRRCRWLVLPESDEQVRRQTDTLPPQIEAEEIVCQHQQQHGCEKQIQVREEASPLCVMAHVPDRVHVNE